MEGENNENSEVHELSEKIEELEELIRQNHRMTRTLYRRSQFSTVIGLVKWLVIIALTVGSFYYIQPYLDKMMAMYSTISSFGGHQAATSTNSWLNIILQNIH